MGRPTDKISYDLEYYNHRQIMPSDEQNGVIWSDGPAAFWDKIIEKLEGNYDKVGWRSITELLDCPRCKLLAQRHRKEVKPTLAKMWRLIHGAALHDWVADVAEDGDRNEERHITAIVPDGEKTPLAISWKPDRKVFVDPETMDIRDYKNVFADSWSYLIEMGPKNEHKSQLQLYAYLARKYLGLKIRRLILDYAIVDWSQKDAERNSQYPQAPSYSCQIPAWSDEYCEKLLQERIAVWLTAEELPDNLLPYASDRERWVGKTCWKVYKKNHPSYRVEKNGKAVPKGANLATLAEAEALAAAKGGEVKKVEPETMFGKVARAKRYTLVEAEQVLAEMGGNEYGVIIEYPAVATRCAKYCLFTAFCNQRQEELANARQPPEDEGADAE